VLAKPVYAAQLERFIETRDVRERTDRFVLRVTGLDAVRNVSAFGCRSARAAPQR
jgi:competence protein ComEC